MENTLYYGDNLKVLREYIKDETIDLIYLDPPFNSNRSYNVLFKDESGTASDAQISAFDDSWHWGKTAQETFTDLVLKGPGNVGLMINSLYKFLGSGIQGHGNQMIAYLVMMTSRLVELHRVLKPSGSLYLHCDPTASHYLKILLDVIFGPQNFRNEIIWKRQSAHNDAKRWGDVQDSILFYSKSDTYTWNKTFQLYSSDYLSKKYRYEDERGIYRLSDLTGAGTTDGDSGKPWRGYNPTNLGRHWAIPQKLFSEIFQDDKTVEYTTQEKLELLLSHNFIYIAKKGTKGRDSFPQYKRYIGDGIPIQSVITDIFPINSQAAERLGYPTQKPLALLERIIKASSNPGDIVLDPFSGCGTCIAAAQKLDRHWVGIDITHLAITMHKLRLKGNFGLEPKVDYRVIGEPEDIAGAQQLAKDDRYQFQWWALSLIEGNPIGGGGKQGKKGSDKGIDGFINFLDKPGLQRALIQVKSGGVKSGDIRDLKGTIEREKAQIGVFVTLEPPSRDMVTEAVTAGNYHSDLWDKDYPRIQILSIEELLTGAEVKLPPTPKDATVFKQAEKVKKEGPRQGELGL